MGPTAPMDLKRSEEMKQRWRNGGVGARHCDYCGGRVRLFKGLGRVCFVCKLAPAYKFDMSVVRKLRLVLGETAT